MKLLVMNGPNLDMLGVREPGVYGKGTLADLEKTVREHAAGKGVELDFFQSNSEGALIDAIHDAPRSFDGIVYNPGAHTHYSYALRDAVGSIELPVVEVHISDVETREAFRHVSVVAPACVAQVKGLGVEGYCRAVDILAEGGEFARMGENYARDCRVDNHVCLGAARRAGGDADGGAEADVPADGADADLNDDDADEASRNRLDSVRAACRDLGIDALLVRDTPNITWLTAIDGVFDEERAHALLVMPDRAALHTDSRYSNAVRTALSRRHNAIAVSDERVTHARFALAEIGASQVSGARSSCALGLEGTISYEEYAKTAETLAENELSVTKDVVLGLRAVKDAREIERLREAQAITDAAFAHIVGFMKPGMTEREVQLELEFFMLRQGAEALAFRSIVATGANGADPHAQPGETVLEAGQCVVLDFGAKLRGYCSDMTRTVFLGAPSAELAKAWDALRNANEAVERALAPGVTGKQAHELAERLLEEGGFGGKMGHGLGHGVGMEVHELPALNIRNDAPLVEGNVVTVEPGIYIPGSFGMRLEDFGVVTATGFDVFTRSTHEMVVI